MPNGRAQSDRAEPGLDAYRALVVLMMFAVHTRRLQTAYGKGVADRALELMMWLEPYIAASFLFIAGFSLVLSHERAKSGWLKKLLLRALGLLVLSIALFVPQYGIELPDLLLSSGILSAIAVSIALTGGALALGDLALVLLGVGVLAVTFVLDRAGFTVSGLNGGPGGAFPLVFFSAVGALIARRRRRPRALAIAAAIGLLVSLFALFTRAPFTTDHPSMYSPHAGELALDSLFATGPKFAVYFWNHSAVGALGLAFPLSLSLWAALALKPRIAPLLLLGRHALAVYVMHLGLLGVIDLVDLRPRNAMVTWIMIAAIALIALGLARGLESKAFTRASGWLGTRRSTTPAADTREPRTHRPPA